MQNIDEQFIQVDDQDRVIGPVVRKIANSTPEIIHRSVKVLVFNSCNELLIQKRSAFKDTFPNCWDVSVAGHVDWGETYLQAALRETHEEIGLDLSADRLKLLGKLLIRLPWETEFQQTYMVVLQKDFMPSFPPEEVSQAVFVSLKQLMRLIKESPGDWASPAKDHLTAFLKLDI